MIKINFKRHIPLILISLFLILAALYLNLAYAHIYDEIGNAGLKGVKQLVVYTFNNDKNSQENKASSSPALKYLALGDSLTFGTGVTEFQNTYPYLVAAQTADKNKDQSLTLYNYSWPGDRTDDLIVKFLDKGISEQPDIITIMIGVNDIHGQISASKFKENYSNILFRLTRETKAKIYVISIPYIGAPNLLLPPYNYYFDYKTKQFNNIIKELALDYNVNYIDLYSPTVNLFKKSGSHYSADLFHPSASGYALWGKVIYDSINK